MLRSGGHEGELVGSVKADEAAGGRFGLEHLGPAVIGKDALDKVLAQREIIEAAFFFHWQEGQALHEGAGEHAGAVSLRYAMLAIHLDAK